MVVCFQQQGEVRKLVLIVPHIGMVTTTKRLQCLEALMAVNYRIAMGKFGLDLDDGEVRLEEAIPLATGQISFEQFRLACSAMMQTVGMYHTLLPRILYSNLAVEEALQICEWEYLQNMSLDDDPLTSTEPLAAIRRDECPHPPELNVDDVLAEVTRMFEEPEE